MTTPLALQRKDLHERGVTRDHRLHTFDSSLAEELQIALDELHGVTWPSKHYREHPYEFFRDVLGVEPWSKQIEIIEGILSHSRVAISSGHKIGKSFTLACIALWYYCTHDKARVCLTSTTAHQVRDILWRQLRIVLAESGICVECKKKNAEDPSSRIAKPCPHSTLIPELPADSPATGLRSSDFREIYGFSSKEAEAVAGISGENIIYLVDEASGIPSKIFEAMDGNRAGGAKAVWCSNPTRNEGPFYDAFHTKKEFFCAITISSMDTPNYIEGRKVIPGLAERGWIEEKRLEWGEDSPAFQIRVLGQFAKFEEGKIFSVHKIQEAQQVWHDQADEAGLLYIGCDPAGATGMGDETAFALRRGHRIISVHRYRGLDEYAHASYIQKFAEDHAKPKEKPVVVLDGEGPIGAKVAAVLRDATEQPNCPFALQVVRSSNGAMRSPNIYDRVRDELAANLERLFRNGLGIPEDIKLEQELHTLGWETRGTRKSLLKLTDKREIRAVLGRSPDTYDAVALACWEASHLAIPVREKAAPTVDVPEPLNPYAGIHPNGGAIDPYG